MKRVSFALVAIALCLVQSAFASINITPNPAPVADLSPVSSTNSWVEFTGGGGGGGGPFIGTLATSQAGLTTSSNTWTTFCVEAGLGTETFVPGQDMRVESISDSVASATGNIVTEAAKWLYVAYSNSLLAGTGAEYQNAIWQLVKTSSSTNTTTNDYSTPTSNWLFTPAASGNVKTLRDAAIAAVTGANSADALALAANVYILNPAVVNSPAVPKQSMLFAVPEASTIAVWSILSLVGAGVAYRRRLQK